MSRSAPDEPLLSILIPNFNNGRGSSKDGGRDFIADLFRSIESTLADDSTPVEIIIADDGSTDDSLETCRAWAEKPWRGGTFCRLIELEHSGCLSAVANRLTSDARGTYCCRLDGDVVIHTPKWAERLVRTFERGPKDLGVIGPKQLGLDGRVHSFGSWVLHPRGHHHAGQGAVREAITRSMEVDHVMGCFYVHRRRVWAELGGYDESLLRGQTVDFGLRAREAGWRTWAVADVEFTHAHAARRKRENHADTQAGIDETLTTFRRKWGFDRLAPDLDVVAERYAGSLLLWNAAVFGPTAPAEDAHGKEPPELTVQNTAWGRYAQDEAYREMLEGVLDIVRQVAAQTGGGCIGFVPGAAGLGGHLAARRGHDVAAFEPDVRAVGLAETTCADQAYPGRAPTFVHQPDPRRLPAEDGSFSMLVLLESLETHPNPVRLLAESARVLKPDGALVLIARERRSVLGEDSPGVFAYRPHELATQIMYGAEGLELSQAKSMGNGRFVAVAQRMASSAKAIANDRAAVIA